MKIYLDTSNLDEIHEGFSLGVVDGITTNPSLIKKERDRLAKKGEPVEIADVLTDILETAGTGHPVSLEVIGTTYDEFIREGTILYEKFNKVADNVVVKIPINPVTTDDHSTQYDGLKAIHHFSENRIPVNCTLIFTPEQALLAAKAGAKYISPFAGRIDDFLRTNCAKVEFDKTDYYPASGFPEEGVAFTDEGIVSGVDLVAQIAHVLETHELETFDQQKPMVLAASLRNARQVRECAEVGADIATLPFPVLGTLLQHGNTVEGMKGFIKDVVPEYRKVFE